jgi:hypothetical protein
MSEIESNENEDNNSNVNNKSSGKPVVKCIFCEKFENQFSRSNIQQKNNSQNSINIVTMSSNNKLFKSSKYSIESKDKEKKEENKKKKKLKKVKKSISAINIMNENKNNLENNEEKEEDLKNSKMLKKKLKIKNIYSKKIKSNINSENQEDNGVEDESNKSVAISEEVPPQNEHEEEQNNDGELPVMLTNLNKSFDKYYKNFNSCGHVICYNCIARLIFTSHLNELPSNEDIQLTCKCNMGSIKIPINDIDKISSKLNLPELQKICDNHGLIQNKFCLECKKWLCKKCIESHADLFGENLHHLEEESPPHNDLCKDHPTCFLDTLCND